MERKLRRSKQRDMILKTLEESKEHPSAEMIYEQLKPKMTDLSLGTVYRNLRLLEDLGQITRLISGDNVERFEVVSHHHAHFVCENCGCIQDIHIDEYEPKSDLLKSILNLNVKRVNVTLEGLCEKCSKKLKEKNN